MASAGPAPKSTPNHAHFREKTVHFPTIARIPPTIARIPPTIAAVSSELCSASSARKPNRRPSHPVESVPTRIPDSGHSHRQPTRPASSAQTLSSKTPATTRKHGASIFRPILGSAHNRSMHNLRPPESSRTGTAALGQARQLHQKSPMRFPFGPLVPLFPCSLGPSVPRSLVPSVPRSLTPET